MTTPAVALAALFSILSPAVLAAPGGAAAPGDSTETVGPSDDPMAWARRVVAVRAAVEAAEAELNPDRRAALAAAALADATALAAESASARPLRLRAQAVYEAGHGPVAAGPLSAAEVGALRGPLLASLGSTFQPALRDPAEAAAARAQAARAAGPAHLFYPAEAVPYVERQRAAAAGLARSARRGRRTLRTIERTLRRRGLPAELKYVAVIESALNPQAESWAGAEGLWQFMPATAAEMGLDSLTVHQVGPSTVAAARYLRWLAGRFDGDWHLALAAYNCGVGRVERLVRSARAELGREPTFWDIRADLPRETQHYVPRFLAVAEALRG